MSNSRRERFALLALLGLGMPLYARHEGEPGAAATEPASAPATPESSTSQDAGEPAETTEAPETTTDQNTEPTEPAEPAAETTPNTLDEILTRLGAATALNPATPQTTPTTPADPKPGQTAKGDAAAAAMLGMSEEELADVEAQLPVAGKKLVDTLKAQAATLEALKADYEQRQAHDQRQAIVQKHKSIDDVVKLMPGSEARYGTSGQLTKAHIAERNATYTLADRVFSAMRDAGTPISEQKAWEWAHTMREGKTIDRPQAVKIVRSEVTARTRGMTVPGGTGKGPAKTNERQDAVNFFNEGLKQLSGQG